MEVKYDKRQPLDLAPFGNKLFILRHDEYNFYVDVCKVSTPYVTEKRKE